MGEWQIPRSWRGKSLKRQEQYKPTDCDEKLFINSFLFLFCAQCRWSDGRSYRGEWKEGRANGYGVETRPNGTIRHDGEWKDDRPIRDSKKNTQGEAGAK